MLAAADPYLEAVLLSQLLNPRGAALLHPGEIKQARRRLDVLLAEHAYDDVRGTVLFNEAQAALVAGESRKASELFADAHRRLAAAGRVSEASFAALSHGSAPLRLGRLDAGREALTATLAYATEHHVALPEANAAAFLAGLLLVRCEFEAFEALAEQRTGDPGFYIEGLRASRAEMQGDVARSLEWLPNPAEAGGTPAVVAQAHGARVRLLWNAARTEQARAEFELVRGGLDAMGLARDFDGMGFDVRGLAPLDEALVELADERFLRGVLAFARARSSPGPDRLVYEPISARCVLRVLAGVALRLDELEEAGNWYRDALEWAERERCPVEAGRCHQGLAELAERHGDHALASQHLDAAGELFSRHGAKLYLD